MLLSIWYIIFVLDNVVNQSSEEHALDNDISITLGLETSLDSTISPHVASPNLTSLNEKLGKHDLV